MSDLQYTLGLDGSDFNATAKAAEKSGMSLGKVLSSLGVTALAGGVLKRGMEFNQTMRDGEAAIAKVIGQFQNLNGEAARAEAGKAMNQLIALEPKAAGSLTDLVGGFMATLAASQSAGISVQENIDLVGRFANAMANANIPTEQLGQEMRSIVTANIGADSFLAKVLGITNEMVKQAAAGGNLYGFLAERIGKLGSAGDTAAVAFSSLQSAVDKAAGSLASGLFDEVLESAKSLSGYVDDNSESFKQMGSAIASAAKMAAGFFSGVKTLTDTLAEAGAMVSLMVKDGISAGEAARALNDLRDSRLTDAAAAKEEAAAAEKTNRVLEDTVNAKARAAASAASATKKAGLTGDEEGAVTKGGKKDKDTATDAARSFDEVLGKQARLDALKRESSLGELTAAGKSAAIRQEILKAEQELAVLRNDPFGQQQSKMLDVETRKVELEREFSALQKESAKDAEAAAKKAEEQAKAQRERGNEQAGNRNNLLAELAILEAQAKGQDKKADSLRRQLQVEREKQDIMRKTGASPEEAARLATRKVDLEGMAAEDKGRGGRSKIGGVTRRRMMGGGVEDFKELQAGESDFERLQKSEFGRDSLASRRSKRSVGSTASRVSRLMGQADARALSERANRVMAPPTKPPDANQKASQDPTLGKLDAILTQLVRITTA